MSRYLGIDPGTTRIGYGIIEEAGAGFRPLAWGIINNEGLDAAVGRERTATELAKLVTEWSPEGAGVERLFFLNNKRSAMAVSEMRGVILLALTRAGVPVSEFTPLQVKQRVCGHASADKAQMQRMVALLLRITEKITPDDAADALALALCCATVRTTR